MKWRCFFLTMVTVLVGIILNLSPAPGFIGSFRPDVLAMMVVFWCMKPPGFLTIGPSFLLGIFMAIMLGSVLGCRALEYSAVAYIMVRYSKSLNDSSVFFQSLAVFSVVLLSQAASLWSLHIFGGRVTDYHILLGSVSCAVLWPFFHMIMSALVRYSGLGRILL